MTKIQWTDKTWSPVTGCTKISPGCKNCYAERMSKRLAGRFGYPPAPDNFKVTLHENKLKEPYKWIKSKMIFVCSMSDLFHEDVPDSFIDDVWDTMLISNQHTYQILTKRPERMKNWIEKHIYDQAYWKNVWFGVSCENKEQADKRIPDLLQTPAAVRFISVEPMLEKINISDLIWNQMRENDYYFIPSLGISWVICGAESGTGARLMNPDWARDLRDQCKNAGIPFFMKQLSKKAPIPDDLMIREYPNG